MLLKMVLLRWLSLCPSLLPFLCMCARMRWQCSMLGRCRESLKPYITELAKNTSVHGSPPMQPLWFQWPDDTQAWAVDDQ